MSDQIKLGTIVDLVTSVKQMTSLLDGADDLDRLREALAGLVEDRKAIMKFLIALKRTRKACATIAEAPLSFVGGFVPDDESADLVPSLPEPRVVPSRARRIASDPKERARIMGDDEDDDG